MAYERERVQWSHTASILAMLQNVHRGPDDDPVTAESLSPYSNAEQDDNKVPLNRETFHLLKSMASKSSVQSRSR